VTWSVNETGARRVAVETIDQFIAELRDVMLTEYPGELAPDTNLFTDVGLDSLELFHVVVFVEDLTGFELAIEEPPQLETVGDAYNLYLGVMAALSANSEPQ